MGYVWYRQKFRHLARFKLWHLTQMSSILSNNYKSASFHNDTSKKLLLMLMLIYAGGANQSWFNGSIFYGTEPNTAFVVLAHVWFAFKLWLGVFKMGRRIRTRCYWVQRCSAKVVRSAWGWHHTWPCQQLSRWICRVGIILQELLYNLRGCDKYKKVKCCYKIRDIFVQHLCTFCKIFCKDKLKWGNWISFYKEHTRIQIIV